MGADEAGFESLVGAEETIVPSRVYSEKALCMSKGFIAWGLTNYLEPEILRIVRWLYEDSEGPMFLRRAVQDSRELLSRRGNRDAGSGPNGRPLSAGAEYLLRRHMPILEERLARLKEEPARMSEEKDDDQIS